LSHLEASPNRRPVTAATLWMLSGLGSEAIAAAAVRRGVPFNEYAWRIMIIREVSSKKAQ
jgi:hypothetical protein